VPIRIDTRHRLMERLSLVGHSRSSDARLAVPRNVKKISIAALCDVESFLTFRNIADSASSQMSETRFSPLHPEPEPLDGLEKVVNGFFLVRFDDREIFHTNSLDT
jgi:hypothetical protein